MARFRVYIKPFLESGVYADDYTEVTSDVASLGDISDGLENTDFDVGVIKNKGVKLTLRNDKGFYSDVNTPNTIFQFTRRNSQVKVTWDFRSYDLIAGFFNVATEPLGGEEIIFKGILNEITSVSDIEAQQISFTALSLDSILDQIEVPYSSISNGDLFSEIFLAILDQAPFNALITVSASNIDPSIDLAIDDKTSLQNKTVGAVLPDLLLAANSVLYIKDDIVYVTAREESASSEHTFRGQASDQGVEDILNIQKYRDGLNRTFNLWTWGDTGVSARDTDSIDMYGVKSKSMSSDVIDDASTSKIQTILNANRDEFSLPKIEMDLETPLWYDVLALEILDQVLIDYPTVYISADGTAIPRYGQVTYDGTARYPFEQWALTVGTETGFKILNRKISVSKQTITFGLREV